MEAEPPSKKSQPFLLSFCTLRTPTLDSVHSLPKTIRLWTDFMSPYYCVEHWFWGFSLFYFWWKRNKRTSEMLVMYPDSVAGKKNYYFFFFLPRNFQIGITWWKCFWFIMLCVRWKTLCLWVAFCIFFSVLLTYQGGHLLFFPWVLDCSVVTHHYLILSFKTHRFLLLFLHYEEQ